MVNLYLNYPTMREACNQYFSTKSKIQTWAQENLNLASTVDFSNYGFWRQTFDQRVFSMNQEIMAFLNYMDKMGETFLLLDDLACKLLNRVYDFPDLLDGTPPEGEYSIARLAEAGDDLFYSQDHYTGITDKCTEVEDNSAYEEKVLDEIMELTNSFKWLSSSDISGEVDAIREDIKYQKYIQYFHDSFMAYANEVAAFNANVSFGFNVVGGLGFIPMLCATRDYTFPGLALNDKQKAAIWFAAYINDYNKETWIDVPDYDTYVEEVYKTYLCASGPAKELFDRYRGNIYIETMTQQGASCAGGGKLYINCHGNVTNAKGPGNTFFHETGHYIVEDTNALQSTEMKAFDQALKDGVGKYISDKENKYRQQLANSGMPAAAIEQTVQALTLQEIEADLNAVSGGHPELVDGLSDMIDAQSNHKYATGYTHQNSDPNSNQTYWEYDTTRQANEAFAEMYAADMMGDSKELQFIKDNFGDVYDCYEDVLDYMLEETK